MNFDQNDPKWTAYLLNELSDTDRKALESEVEENPEARQWLEEMREASVILENTYSHETELHLPSQTKNSILAKSRERKKPMLTLLPTLAAAAVVALTFGGWWMLEKQGMGKGIPEQVLVETVPAQEKNISRTNIGTDKPSRQPVRELKPSIVSTEDASGEVKEEAGTGNRPLTQKGEKKDHNGVEAKSLLSQSLSGVSSPVEKDSLRFRTWVQPGQSIPSGGRAPLRRLESEIAAPPPVISPSLDHFAPMESNKFQKVADHPLSTFSIDVDTASYSVVRTYLERGEMPPRDAVRIEELVNYFPYDYEPPTDGEAFAAHMEVAACPWAPAHLLVRVALKGREIPVDERPALNLVYLLDVSGSMNQSNKLPLVKRSLEALATQLDARDRVAIVVYAGAAGLVLPSTSGEDTKEILEALRRLNAGGGTAGGAGIQLAYNTAREQFVEGGVNRVILCTDGDFNIGLSQTGDLERLIEKEAKSGVFLTALGFGMGNYKDSKLEALSNKGNGNYAYIDDFSEARKVLVDQMLGTMVTIAKDVKIQVEFNPSNVAGYRLIGYENRMLKKEDFNNDNVDAGEIGAGHTVTAFYEVVPAGQPVPGDAPKVDALRYQSPRIGNRVIQDEILTLKLRHKQPDGEKSVKREYALANREFKDQKPSSEFTFASSVAAFGLWLRDPSFAETYSVDEIIRSARDSTGLDAPGHRRKFLDLVRNAAAIPRKE